MATKEDLHILIDAKTVAWITNRTIVLINGDVFHCPIGWEAYGEPGTVSIHFEPPTPEFCNA